MRPDTGCSMKIEYTNKVIDADTVAVRSRKDGDLGTMTTEAFAALLRKHEQERS